MSISLFSLIVASAVCLGYSVRDNSESDTSGTLQADVGELCRVAQRSGCGKIAQEAVPDESETQSVSMSVLAAYFLADATDADAFWQKLGLPAEPSCEELCTQSLRHVNEEMQWPLPDRNGFSCASWSGKSKPTCLSWISESDSSMEYVAANLDLATDSKKFEEKARNGTVGEAIDEVSTVEHVADKGTGVSYTFHYTTDDLAVRVANIFDVFPSEPVDTDEKDTGDDVDGSSVLLENGDVPTFGYRVKEERKALWTATLEQSQSWVRSASSKMPGNRKAVRLWFGNDDTATYDAVRRVIVGMQRTLDKAKIALDEVGGCGGGTVAYVKIWIGQDGEFTHSEMTKDDRYVIHVCEHYWEPQLIADPASKYGTLVHESAHHHGPRDRASQDGQTAYGRARSLRLASKSPTAAVDNADNYRWFVYYLNRCTNAPTRTSSAAPCELTLEPAERGGWVRITAQCSEKIVGTTLKVTDASGKLKQASVKGAFDAGNVKLGKHHLAEGTRVALFFETECIFWEAVGVVKSAAMGAQSYDAIALHVLSSGDSKSTNSSCKAYCQFSHCGTGSSLYQECNECAFCAPEAAPPRRRAPTPPRRRAPKAPGPCDDGCNAECKMLCGLVPLSGCDKCR